jgi:outer membrane protein assembly factor BamB
VFLCALEADTGKEVWREKVENRGSLESLTISGGIACFESGGSIYGHEVATGKKLWQAEAPVLSSLTRRVVGGRGGALTAVMLTVSDSPLKVVDGSVCMVRNDALILVELKTGKKTSATLDLGDDGEAKGVAAVAVNPVGVAVARARPVRASIGPTGGVGDILAVSDGVAYVGANGALHAVDVKTGSRLWRLPLDNAVTGLKIQDGVLYFATRSLGNVVVSAAASGSTVTFVADKEVDKNSPGLGALKLAAKK